MEQRLPTVIIPPHPQPLQPLHDQLLDTGQSSAHCHTDTPAATLRDSPSGPDYTRGSLCREQLEDFVPIFFYQYIAADAKTTALLNQSHELHLHLAIRS